MKHSRFFWNPACDPSKMLSMGLPKQFLCHTMLCEKSCRCASGIFPKKPQDFQPIWTGWCAPWSHCLAFINGCNFTPWYQQVKLDVSYFAPMAMGTCQNPRMIVLYLGHECWTASDLDVKHIEVRGSRMYQEYPPVPWIHSISTLRYPQTWLAFQTPHLLRFCHKS